MADPYDLDPSENLYQENDVINHAITTLYDPNMDFMPQRVPTTDEMVAVFQNILSPFLDPDADDEFTNEDLQGLIVNMVFCDALMDREGGIAQELPETYDPLVLLNLIGTARGFVPRDRNSELLSVRAVEFHGQRTPIFHWASERLFPFFGQYLGLPFILQSRTEYGNSYLHSYLQSCTSRMMNPTFVKELLSYGFDLRERNADGSTPLHLIIRVGLLADEYAFPVAHVSEEEQKANPDAKKRYNRFYRTLQLLFAHPTANLDIPDNDGLTVRMMMESGDFAREQNHRLSYQPNNVREAYDRSRGRPRAMERARQQAAVEQIPSLPSNVSKIIRNMMGTNLQSARKAVKAQGKQGGRHKTRHVRKTRHAHKTRHARKTHHKTRRSS